MLSFLIAAGIVFGTGALPFVFGASFSFFSSTLLYYRSCLTQAVLASKRYPHLMLMHLDGNYPAHQWNLGRMKFMLNSNKRSWTEDGMMVSAWQSAGTALDVCSLLFMVFEEI